MAKAQCKDCGIPVDYRQLRCRKCYDLSRERWQICLKCSKPFKASPSSHRKYCSKKCEGFAKRGENNHFYGKKHSPITKSIISAAKKGVSVNKESKNTNWKGSKVGYCALHAWVRRHKPKPALCEKCYTNQPRELALRPNKEYERKLDNFQWLCIKCHRAQDKGWKWSNEQKKKLTEIVTQKKRDNKGRFC